MLEYVDFEVKIERRRGKEYAVSVIKSPAGEASGTFVLPFTPKRLKGIRETIEIALVRSMMPVRRVVPPEFEKVEEFGRELYTALFKDDVKSCYDRSSSVAFSEGKGLRLKLRIDPTLINLPWEFMYSREIRDYLALSRTVPPVRYTELPQPVVPLEVTLPLRILVVIASPSGYASLNVEREKERITSALKELQEQGIIKVEFLEGKNTLAALQRRLRQADYHVLHFIGHGGYDEEAEEGLLLMEDARGRGRPVRGLWLGRLLRGYFPMRLVVLNACEGALTSSSDPFAGVAAAVVGAGVPAVVAMQFEISDEAAIIFSREFYSALADNYPVDAAVTEARMAIVHSRENTVEWGTPVLYMRAPDGMLFNVAPAEEKVAVAPKEAIKLGEERLAALYAEVQELLEAEDWSEAIARCGEILALDPTYRDAASLLVKAKDGLDLQERRQAREERLSHLYNEGMRYLAEGRWREAIDEFKQVLALEESYKDAAARLAAAEEEVAKAEAERERQKKLSNLYEQGVAALRAQQWPKAVALLEQVQAIESGYRDTTSLLDRAQRDMARLKEKQEREEQLSALYGKGLNFFNEGRWQQAIARFQQVVDLEEGYKDAAAKLAAAQEELAKAEVERKKQEKLAALYEQAVAAMNAKQWQEALDLLEQVQAIDPSYRATKSLIAEAQAEAAKMAKAVVRPGPRPIAPPTKPFPWRAVAIGSLAWLVVLVGIVAISKDLDWLRTPTPMPLTKVTATLPVATPRPTATPLPPTSTAVIIVPRTATPTPVPAETPTPTVTSRPTPTPTETSRPTPTPSCPAVSGPFSAVWNSVQGTIGCAASYASTGFIVEENFEGGKMFWREPIDYAQILALFNDGTWQIVEHSSFTEGSPEFSCPDANTPSECPPTPKRGFGMVWCDTPEIRSRLGNAIDCERGYQGSMQQFERGFMLQTDSGAIYVFYDDGYWERSGKTIEDFEYPDEEALNRNYWINAPGNELHLSLAGPPHVFSGQKALAFHYNIVGDPPSDYAGMEHHHMGPMDWRGYSALCLWVQSDGFSGHLVVQFHEQNSETWKYHISLRNLGTQDVCIQLDEHHFLLADFSPHHNERLDLGAVDNIAFYVGHGGKGEGTIYLDALRLKH